MRLPSGDQSNVPTPFLRLVTRRASPPSSESTQTWLRGCGSPAAAAVCKALGTPGVVAVPIVPGIVAGAGVSVACGTVWAGSGVEAGVGVGVACEVVCVGVLPSDDGGRAERNASERPSGDQRGEVEDCVLVVNCRGGRVASVGAIQICDCRRFCLWSTVVTTYATRLPSGETRGSPANSNAK